MRGEGGRERGREGVRREGRKERKGEGGREGCEKKDREVGRKERGEGYERK